MNEKNFRQKSIEKIWLPVTRHFLEAHNAAMIVSNNNDQMYSNCLYLFTVMLEPIYVETNLLTKEELYRTSQLIPYIMEFHFGNPYAEGKQGLENTTWKYIKVDEMFHLIRKYWNVNIKDELNKIDKVKNYDSLNCDS